MSYNVILKWNNGKTTDIKDIIEEQNKSREKENEKIKDALEIEMISSKLPLHVKEGINDLKDAIKIANEQNSFFNLYTNQEDEIQLESTDVINSQNGLTVWSSKDCSELQKYMNYDFNEWNTLGNGHHREENKPSVYFDIDGTLAHWHTNGKGLTFEEMLDPANHYFRDLEPHEMMVSLAKEMHERGQDVCIISAAAKETIRDKWDWIEEHLPFIPKENICFSPLGADKSDFVKGNAEISVLIDDYNKNLEQWRGDAIKAITPVNSSQINFDEIDFIRHEKLLKDTEEMELSPKEIEKITNYCNSAVKEVAETIINQMEKNEIKREYENYKKEWIEENIDDITYAETMSQYENTEEAENMSFDEYVETFGYADRTCYVSFEEFCDKELPIIRLADEIEQFMFERGEYDYNEDLIGWIAEEGEIRTETTKNILHDLKGDIESLQNYFKDEVATIDNEDESLIIAKDILEKINQLNPEPVINKNIKGTGEITVDFLIENYNNADYQKPFDSFEFAGWMLSDAKATEFKIDPLEHFNKFCSNNLSERQANEIRELITTAVDNLKEIEQPCRSEAGDPNYEWRDWDDGSGALMKKDEDGKSKSIAGYDRTTNEIEINGKWEYFNGKNLNEIKEHIMERVKEKELIKEEPKKERKDNQYER